MVYFDLKPSRPFQAPPAGRNSCYIVWSLRLGQTSLLEAGSVFGWRGLSPAEGLDRGCPYISLQCLARRMGIGKSRWLWNQTERWGFKRAHALWKHRLESVSLKKTKTNFTQILSCKRYIIYWHLRREFVVTTKAHLWTYIIYQKNIYCLNSAKLVICSGQIERINVHSRSPLSEAWLLSPSYYFPNSTIIRHK